MELVHFNVGGENFTTYSSTVAKSDYLTNLINEQPPAEKIFINRSSMLFREIILYLRTGTIFTKDLKTLCALESEATFYQINSMTDVVKTAITEAEILLERESKKPKVVLKDLREIYSTFRNTKKPSPKIKLVEEVNGIPQTYSLLDIVYVKDINRCFEHSKAYCECSVTPKLVLVPTDDN